MRKILDRIYEKPTTKCEISDGNINPCKGLMELVFLHESWNFMLSFDPTTNCTKRVGIRVTVLEVEDPVRICRGEYIDLGYCPVCGTRFDTAKRKRR